MDTNRAIRVSKYLTRHLRHNPERLGITLEPGGWVGVDDLLAACALQSFALTREELMEVVASSDKRRFSFDETSARIRANQGHSVEIDLQLDPTQPPPVLFHGTGHGYVGAILGEGLVRMGRHHVHLSADIATAEKVGKRHGRPVVFEVAAGRMAGDGFAFFVSRNSVWLTDRVPSEYLTETGRAS